MSRQEAMLRQVEREPSSLERVTSCQERLAAGFALIAGFVDAYAYFHYKTYVFFMNGNTTVGSSDGAGQFCHGAPVLSGVC